MSTQTIEQTTTEDTAEAPARVYPTTPCSNCGKPMRKRGIPKELAEDSVATGHGGRCKGCCKSDLKSRKAQAAPKAPAVLEEEPVLSPEEAERRIAEATNALGAYFRSRGRSGSFAARFTGPSPAPQPKRESLLSIGWA